MPQLWLPGAERIGDGPHKHSAGLPMDGTKGRYATHHITVTGKGSYAGTKNALLSEGYEPTLIVDPTTGQIGQFFPANRGGYALEHPSGTPTTNTEGTIHVQIEWVWPAMWKRLHPNLDITRAPHFAECWQKVALFCRQLGIPEVWPFGLHSDSKDLGLWRQSGHRGHINAPHNSHSDNLPAAKPPAFPSRAVPIAPARRKLADETTAFLAARRTPLPDVDAARV